MIAVYCELHQLGFAHSVEAFQDNVLVGGLYGVCLGGVFFGESMFSAISNSSKVAFHSLIQLLKALRLLR
jgi:leucyl/phenylalanyl-tRNA--protein transferase